MLRARASDYRGRTLDFKKSQEPVVLLVKIHVGSNTVVLFASFSSQCSEHNRENPCSAGIVAESGVFVAGDCPGVDQCLNTKETPLYISCQGASDSRLVGRDRILGRICVTKRIT